MNPNCSHCAFAVPQKTMQIGQYVAACHGRPPQVLIVPAQGGAQMTSVFPAVSNGPDFWCGDFEPRAAALEKVGE